MPRDWCIRTGWFALIWTLLAFGGVGCAQDVGDIDRTQPDKIEKSVFEDGDEWYFQQTVIDTTTEGQSGVDIFPFPHRGQGALFTAQVSRKLKRVKWEIHEDVLYARSTVEPADGVTEQVDGEKHQELGIVAAFPIKSHFDIQRQYNTSTGEPSNVIVENRNDRPWHDREYMRVDWSTNLVTSFSSVFSGLGLMSPKAAAKSQRAVPQSEERVDPHRTRISENIVDATSEFVFNPDLFACVQNFGTDSLWRCEGGTATVRNFFWRVDARKKHRYGNTDQNYKPMLYRDDLPVTEEAELYRDSDSLEQTDGGDAITAGTTFAGQSLLQAECNDAVNERNETTFARTADEQCDPQWFGYFSRFGYFRTNRATWSEGRETYDAGRQQFANRWNIWETMYDPNGELIEEMSERNPEPIVFHLNAAYPKHMMEAADRIESKWDETFKNAVAVAQEKSVSEVEADLEELGHDRQQMFVIAKNSCHPSKIAEWRGLHGGTKDADRKDISAIFGEHVGGESGDALVDALWELPVKERKRLCAKLEWSTEKRSSDAAKFTWERMGDLRHSFFAWITDYNIGWLGYGPSSADPKSGEIISGAANFAGRLLEPYANYGADIVKYLNCDPEENPNGYCREEIEDGDHVRDQLEQQAQREEQEQELGPEEEADGAGSGSTKGINLEELKTDRMDSVDETRPTPLEEVGLGVDELQEMAYRSIDASISADASDTRMLEWLEEPGMKKRLMSNPMMKSAVETLAVERNGEEALEDDDRVHQAYLALNAPMLFEARMERRERLLRENNIFSASAAQQMVQGLATYGGAAKRFRGKSHDEIADYFRENVFYGTQLHEIGHAVGLRHNFSASMDAINYHDEFWEIEKVKQLGCEGRASEGACSDGKLTNREARRGGKDLADEIYGEDQRNPGYLSQAEFRVASVMDYTAGLTGRFAGLGKYDQAAINFAYARRVEQWNDDVGLYPGIDIDLREADYEIMPSVYGDKSVDDPRSACRSLNSEGEVVSIDSGCVERGIRHLKEDREWIPIDEAIEHQYKVLSNNGDAVEKIEEDEETNFSNVADDISTDRIVPYRFCTDDREGRFLGCQAFDWGSNQFEVLGYAIQEFETLQPFKRYRGAEINGRGFISQFTGLQNNYLGDLIQTLQLVDTPFRYFSFYETLGFNVGAFTEDLEQASRLGLNYYSNLLTTPKPGRYCYYEENDVSPKYNMNEKAVDAAGAFVPDDVYFKDGALGECRAEIARIHEVESERYSVEVSFEGTSVTVDYSPEEGDTPSDVAAGLEEALETEIESASLSLNVTTYENDLVVEPFSGGDRSYSLKTAQRNQTSETAWTSMSSPHTIEKGTGEFFAYEFTPEYNYRLDRVGTFIDKVFASSRLFQMDANITFAEFATDLRATNINYWTEFPDELYNLLHGMFLGDYGRFGGGYSPIEETYQRANLAPLDDKGVDVSLAERQQRAMPERTWSFVSPTSFDIRMRLVANALAEFSTYEDKVTDFDEYLVVAATQQERQNLPSDLDPSRVAEFVHPVTNRTYVAVQAEDGRSISYDLLQWANEVKQQYLNASEENSPQRVDETYKELYREDLENIVARINLIRDLRALYFEEG